MVQLGKLRYRLTGLALILLFGLGIVGCDKASDSAAPGPPPAGGGSQDVLAKLPGGEEFAAAKKIYVDNNCANCHRLGETGKPKGAPELTKIGADAEHTKTWIADHIRDPKKHRPQSKMPMYGADKINDGDLEKLAAYLSSMK